MEDGGWRMEDGGWRMEDGGWRMEDGGWRMEDGEDFAIDYSDQVKLKIKITPMLLAAWVRCARTADPESPKKPMLQAAWALS
jgi:hypothetical protein